MIEYSCDSYPFFSLVIVTPVTLNPNPKLLTPFSGGVFDRWRDAGGRYHLARNPVPNAHPKGRLRPILYQDFQAST